MIKLFLITSFYLPILSFAQPKTNIVSFDRVLVSEGDIAPEFSGYDETGKLLKLSDLSQKKNLVLIFFRGYW